MESLTTGYEEDNAVEDMIDIEEFEAPVTPVEPERIEPGFNKPISKWVKTPMYKPGGFKPPTGVDMSLPSRWPYSK